MKTRTLLLFAAALLITGCAAPSASAKGKARQPRTKAPKQDVYLQAMQAELKRSIDQLKLAELERPYFIEYFLWDIRSVAVDAASGALIRADENDQRPFRVDVRVGDYKRDNSGYIDQTTFRSLFSGLGQFMLAPDDVHALRYDLWLMTDAAYKQALEQLAGKRALLKNEAQAEPVDDFAHTKPVEAIGPRNPVRYDFDQCQQLARRLSAVFRRYPAIQSSRVELRADFATRYLVNSEGTRMRQPCTTITLRAHASTQADDGMPLKHYVAWYARSMDGLPPEDVLRSGIEKMAGELVALRGAPVLDSYSGPVLFSGKATADLLHQVLAPRLLAHRRPLIGIPQVARMASQIEENRLGRRLLPRSFSVTDDPTLKHHAGLGLIGRCQFDDEGVAARKTQVVDKGKVKALLASRTPMTDVPASTGHGRRSIPGFNQAQITNLLVDPGQKTLTARKLEKRLLETAAEMDLDFALLIEQLDDPDITGREFSLQAMMSSAMGGASGKDRVNPPLLAYKIHPDGRRELVRGLSFQEFSLRSLRDIEAAGDTPAVCHKLAGGGLGKIPIPLFFSMAGGRGPKIPRAPTSLVAPALLFEELELNKIEGASKKPVALPRP